MASGIVVATGFGAIVLMLAAVVGSVERRERFTFAGGVVLVLLGLVSVAVVNAPPGVGAVVALAGIVAVVASTVPLLIE